MRKVESIQLAIVNIRVRQKLCLCKPFDSRYSWGNNPDGVRWDDHLYFFFLVREGRRTLVVESNEIAAASDKMNQSTSLKFEGASFWYEIFSPASNCDVVKETNWQSEQIINTLKLFDYCFSLSREGLFVWIKQNQFIKSNAKDDLQKIGWEEIFFKELDGKFQLLEMRHHCRQPFPTGTFI